MSNPQTPPDRPPIQPEHAGLIIKTLQTTIAELTERNQKLEASNAEALQAVDSLMAKPGPKPTGDPAHLKRLADSYIASQFNLCMEVLDIIEAVLVVASQRPLTDIQQRVVLKYLHSEVMRGACSVASATSKGIDHSFLLGVDSKTVEDFLRERNAGDKVRDIKPEQPFGNS